MADLGSIVEAIQSSPTAERAFERFSDAIQHYGYDKACYTLLTDCPSIGQRALKRLASSYPEDWLKHYEEEAYVKNDPIWLRLLEPPTPFFWRDAVKDRKRKASIDPKLILQGERIVSEGADAGVADGIGVSFTNHLGETAGIAISREKPVKSKSFRDLSQVYLLSSVFHDRYLSLFDRAGLPRLTTREKDVLAWSAEGKTDWEIAQILGVSTHTVRFHWNNVFKKLKTNNKLHATMTAVRRNVISPGSIGAQRKDR